MCHCLHVIKGNVFKGCKSETGLAISDRMCNVIAIYKSLSSTTKIYKKDVTTKIFITSNMPKHCVAFGCTNHHANSTVSFHRFPAEPERRKLWVLACKRINADGSKWTPSQHAVLCGAHFISGNVYIYFLSFVIVLLQVIKILPKIRKKFK